MAEAPLLSLKAPGAKGARGPEGSGQGRQEGGRSGQKGRPDAGPTTVKLDEAAFAQRFQEALVHESVRAEQAARRRGTAATKTRAMVSGGGAKPWRQKGTGRARAGSNRSPLWSGGGVVFGPQPRSYTFKVNRKQRRAALRSALSLHASRGSLALLDAGAFSEPKTSQARELLEGWDQVRPTLVVLAAKEREAALSFRNLARVSVLSDENVGVADLLGAASLLVSQAALDALTARATGRRAEGAVETPAEGSSKSAAKGAGKGAAKGAGKGAAKAAAAESAPGDAAKSGADAEDAAEETA
jgi:large subunit ribosomal protein L4